LKFLKANVSQIKSQENSSIPYMMLNLDSAKINILKSDIKVKDAGNNAVVVTFKDISVVTEISLEKKPTKGKDYIQLNMKENAVA